MDGVQLESRGNGCSKATSMENGIKKYDMDTGYMVRKEYKKHEAMTIMRKL